MTSSSDSMADLMWVIWPLCASVCQGFQWRQGPMHFSMAQSKSFPSKQLLSSIYLIFPEERQCQSISKTETLSKHASWYKFTNLFIIDFSQLPHRNKLFLIIPCLHYQKLKNDFERVICHGQALSCNITINLNILKLKTLKWLFCKLNPIGEMKCWLTVWLYILHTENNNIN